MILKIETEAEWLSARKKLITASDVSVLFGLNPWKSIDQLYDEKTTNYTQFVANEAVTRGKISEPYLRALTEVDLIYNLKTHIRGEYHPYWIYVDDDCRALGSTLDGILYRQDMLLDITEYKTGTKRTVEDFINDWGTDTSPSIAWHYLPQVYTQLACVHNASGNIVRPRILIEQGTNRLPTIKDVYRYIPRDELTENWISRIREICFEFAKCVRKGTRPNLKICIKEKDLWRMTSMLTTTA